MTDRELLADCLGRLEKAGFDYYVTGSMASTYWGMPRSTHDIDLVICLRQTDVERIVLAFQVDYYIDEESVRAAFRPPWQFNAIDNRSTLKVDFWIPKHEPFDQQMLARRQRVRFVGIEAWIASPEDVILHKLLWDKITPSERQVRDAAGVWSVQGDRLDYEYLRDWGQRLGVTEPLEKILAGGILPKST